MRTLTKVAKITGLSLATVLLTMSGLKASPGNGPHGGVMLGNERQQMELSFDFNQRKVEVYVIKNEVKLPEAIALSVLDANGKRRVLELRTLDGIAEPTHYQGALGPGAQSYAGFELRIPLRSEAPLVLKNLSPR